MADAVWFADCDMLLRSETFAALKQGVARKPDGMLYCSRQVRISIDYAGGDEEIELGTTQTNLGEVEESKFMPKRYQRVIGGAQFVRGARKHGYVPLKRFRRPAWTWQRTIEHIFVRKLLDPPQYAINLPGAFHIRHSKCGRADVGC